MAHSEMELSSLLDERRHFADRTTDEYGSRRNTYQEWNDRVRVLDYIAANEWDVVWPDQVRERSLPKIPNWVVLAAEHRARLIAETMPTNTRRPEKASEAAKKSAEKVERILAGYWGMNDINLLLPYWGLDLQYTGLSAVKVLPDFSKPKSERFPVYTRLDPRQIYPSPLFTRGPIPDDCIISYTEYIPVLEKRFGEDLTMLVKEGGSRGNARKDKARVIEFYDSERCMVIVEVMFRNTNGTTLKKPHLCVLDEKHGLGKTPIALGVRPTQDNIYRGDFDSMIAMLNTNNRLMTLHMDSAVSKVYPVLVVDEEVQDPDQEGPGATLVVNSGPGGVLDHIGYLQTPASAYDNYNMLRMMDNNLRTAALLPQSVTGNPDESVISAAGIAATQSMPNAEVVSLQRDCIAPMLRAANELALCGDVKWANTTKTVSGQVRGASFTESYTPKEDIGTNYSNEVVYGMGSGLDKVNTGIMVKQDLGAGLISKQTAMEKNPFIDDPQREQAQIVKETMQQVGLASILAATQLPEGAPGRVDLMQVSKIWDDIDKGVPIQEALRNHAEAVALVPPPNPTPVGGNLASPGIAGGAEPQPGFAGPPIDQLTG